MTNNEIVENIYRTINIRELVRKNIANSVLDSSDDDLVQYILCSFLEMDNKVLNDLWNRKLIRPWIVRIIWNQRNYYRSDYNLYFIDSEKLPITDEIVYESIEDEDNFSDKVDLIEEIMYERFDIAGISGFTMEQLKDFTSIELLKMYIFRDHTFTSLSKSLKISRTTVNDTLKYAKSIVKKEFDERK